RGRPGQMPSPPNRVDARTLSGSDAQIVEDALGGLAALVDGGDHQVGTAHHVAAGEHLGVAGLELETTLGRSDHAALLVGADAEVLEPGRRARTEAEGDHHGIGRQDLLGTGNRLGAATTAGVRLAQAGFHHLDAFHAVLADNGHRLAVEQELHAFVLGVLHLAARAGHVPGVAAVGAGHALGALADRGAVAVHGGVATTEHHDLLALHVDEVFRRLLVTQVAVAVGHQEIQRGVHAGQVLAGNATLHVGVSAHAHEHGIELFQQLFHGHVTPHLGVQAELDAHASEHFAATADDLLLQLELRDAEGQQTADLRVAVEHHRGHAVAHQHALTTDLDAHASEHCAASADDPLLQLELRDAEGQQTADLRVAVEHHRGHAVPHQHVGAAQAGRAGADHRDALAGRHHPGQVGAPAHGEGGVGDVLLHRADGHRAETGLVQGAGALAQAVLRTDAAADFRQGVGLVAELGGGQDVALRHQLQPVGNVVVYRALPLAVGVAAFQAAVGLLAGLVGLEGFVDLHEVLLAYPQQLFPGVLAIHFEELEVVVQTFSHVSKPLVSGGWPLESGCGAGTAPAAYCGLARVLASSCLRLAALGLTSQKRRR